MQQHINYSSLQVRDETVTKVGYESRIVNAFSLFLHTVIKNFSDFTINFY